VSGHLLASVSRSKQHWLINHSHNITMHSLTHVAWRNHPAPFSPVLCLALVVLPIQLTSRLTSYPCPRRRGGALAYKERAVGQQQADDFYSLQYTTCNAFALYALICSYQKNSKQGISTADNSGTRVSPAITVTDTECNRRSVINNTLDATQCPVHLFTCECFASTMLCIRVAMCSALPPASTVQSSLSQSHI
jgi:hypothetical protein